MRGRYLRVAGFFAAAVLTICSCASPVAGTGNAESGADDTRIADGAGDDGTSSGDVTQPETSGTDAVSGDGTPSSDSAMETSGAEEKKQGEGEHILYSSLFGDVAYIIDSEGNKLTEYDLASARKLVGDDTSLFSFEAIGDGLLYFGIYVTVGEDSVFRVYAVDPANRETAVVWTAEVGQSQESVDFYEGKLHITYSTEDGKGERVFVRTPGKLVFEEEASPLDDFFRAAGPYTLFGSAREPLARYEKCCYERMLDEYSHVVGRNYEDNKWVLLSRDGGVTEITTFNGRNAYVEGYDEGYMFVETFNDDYSTNDLSVLNLETFGERKTDLSYDDSSILGMRDGCIYYSVDQSKEYYRADNHIFRYDLAENATDELYSAQAVPGATSVQAGIQDFKMIGDRIYYIGVSDDILTWHSVDINGGTPADTGLKVAEISAFKYGKVECKSQTDKCQFCGIDLSKQYAETLVLDPSWSDQADKISTSLRNNVYKGFGGADSEYEPTDEECDSHREYPDMWCTTVDDSISDVYVISDRYLAVDISGYWYGGGAHGYPERGQYIFDLKTGERLELKDLYSGSNEDFKKLVAQKTKEDFIRQEKDEEYTQYFAESAEEAYNSAYDTANLESTYVEFMEDGALIVFPPYEMGSYAAGYIEIPVSYKELFGRDKM